APGHLARKLVWMVRREFAIRVDCFTRDVERAVAVTHRAQALAEFVKAVSKLGLVTRVSGCKLASDRCRNAMRAQRFVAPAEFVVCAADESERARALRIHIGVTLIVKLAIGSDCTAKMLRSLLEVEFEVTNVAER